MIQDKDKVELSPADIERAILLLRGRKVMLDSDLALIYGVTVKRLNEQVKRNRERFPADFAFQVRPEEWAAIRHQTGSGALRSQFATLKRGQHRKYVPYAFTEHGALMAANVLNSPRAVQMSVFVVRAFVRMRAALSGNRALAKLEHELQQRFDVHESAIVDVLRRLMDIIDPPLEPDPPPKPIGFHVKERRAVYGASRAAARS